MSLAKKVAWNAFIQIVGRILGLVIVLVTTNYVANYLIVNGSPVTGYGEYTIVTNYLALLVAALDLGIYSIIVREISRGDAKEGERIIGNSISFRLLLLLASLLILFPFYHYLPYSQSVKQGILVAVVIAFIMLASQVIAAIFQAYYTTYKIVIAETLGKLLTALVTIYVLRAQMGLVTVIFANLAGNVVILLASYYLARPMIRVRLHFDWQLLKKFAPEFWPVAVVTILSLVHYRVDTLILSLTKPASDVGIYGVAYKILDLAQIIPTIIATNLLPVMTEAYHQSDQKLSLILSRSTLLMIVIGMIMTLLGLILGPYFIIFITRQEFVSSILPAQLLSLAFTSVCLSNLVYQAVIVARRQKQLIWVYLTVTVVNLIANLIFIPRYSYLAAASVTFATETLLAILLFIVITKVLNLKMSFVSLSRLFVGVVLAGLINWKLVPRLFDFQSFLTAGKLHQVLVLVGVLIVVGATSAVLPLITYGRSLTNIKQSFTLNG